MADVALITGASTGIGRELALLCAAAGYDLAITARSRDGLEKVAAEVRQKFQRNVLVISADLAQADAPRQIFEATGSTLQVLINNAGFGALGLFSELDEQQQVDMVTVNVAALTHLTRLFVPGMIARRSGYVLNVASTAAFQPGPLMAVYYATKAYVVSFSEALHNELKGSGVSVTVLCPGPTATEFQVRAKMQKTKLFSGGGMDAATVAKIGFDGMLARKSCVIAGRQNAIVAFMTRFVPRQFAAGLARRLQEG